MTGIYKIISISCGKTYIGSSTNLDRRKYEHFYNLKKSIHTNSVLSNFFNKHGKDDLVFEVIELVDGANLLIEREQFWIDKLNPVFNIRKIADRNTGIKYSDAHKKRLSEIRKLNPSKTVFKKGHSTWNKGIKTGGPTMAARQKTSLKTKGVPKSLEHSRKISAALKGKPKTAEHKRKLSFYKKGRPSYKRTAEMNEKMSLIKTKYYELQR